jgi:two-component system LytT family response regulator
METIKAFMVDDEKRSARILSSLVTEYCPDIEIIGSAHSASSAFKQLLKLPVDLLFLDIEMPIETGFDLLGKLAPHKFEVIFLTAHPEYAVKAFSYEAFDYIVKPVGIENLIKSIDRLRIKLRSKQQAADGEKDRTGPTYLNSKIALPGLNGLMFINLMNITRLDAKGSYTVIVLNDKKEIVVSRYLKEVEEKLPSAIFLRIHDSNTVNINYVKNYTNGRGGYIEMEDGTILNVSARRKEAFLTRFSR